MVLVLTSLTVYTSHKITYGQNITSENIIGSNSSSSTDNSDVNFEEDLALKESAIIPNQFIVTLRDNTTLDTWLANNTILTSAETNETNIEVIEKLLSLGTIIIEIPISSQNNESTNFIISKLENDPHILAVEQIKMITIR